MARKAKELSALEVGRLKKVYWSKTLVKTMS
jgi:hypothetical protein